MGLGSAFRSYNRMNGTSYSRRGFRRLARARYGGAHARRRYKKLNGGYL